MLRARITCIKKQENSHGNNLTAQWRAPEQDKANTGKRSRRQEIIKLRDEINKTESKRIQRIN